MATMTWDNGTTVYPLPLPDKDGIRAPKRTKSSGRTALSGKLGVDVRPAKTVITVSWTALTTAEYTLLETAWDNCWNKVSTLTLPNGNSYLVVAAHFDWDEAQLYDISDTNRPTVRLQFEEVG